MIYETYHWNRNATEVTLHNKLARELKTAEIGYYCLFCYETLKTGLLPGDWETMKQAGVSSIKSEYVGIKMVYPKLTQPQIEKIAQILGDTSEGFSGSEIGLYLAQCSFIDPDPRLTKWKRLYNAFCEKVNNDKSTNAVFEFMLHCFEPAQGLRNQHRYSWMRNEINRVLMLVGVEVRDDGKFYPVSKAQSLSEVQRRTKELRNKLTGYGVHYQVIKCCKDELLAEDYFHAVQEAAKSLCDRVREMTGLTIDGADLFNTAFSIHNPYIAFNRLETSSEKNQQNGLKEMLCGVIHMVRNVTAHELRIRWDINEIDAVDILTQISYLHKLLDECVAVPRL